MCDWTGPREGPVTSTVLGKLMKLGFSKVVTGGRLCDGPIPRPEESHRLWYVYLDVRRPKRTRALELCGEKSNKFHDELSDSELVKKDSAQQSYLACYWNPSVSIMPSMLHTDIYFIYHRK
jgi:hypothetical protein